MRSQKGPWSRRSGVLIRKQRGSRDSSIFSPSFFLSLSHTHLPVRVWVGRWENTVRFAKKKKNQPGYFLFSSPNLKKQVQNNLKWVLFIHLASNQLLANLNKKKTTGRKKRVILLEIHGQVGIKVLVQLFIAGSCIRMEQPAGTIWKQIHCSIILLSEGAACNQWGFLPF